MDHSDGHFKGLGRVNLCYQSWLPSHEPKAVLLLVHGLAEHCGFYNNLVNYLVPRGYGVYAYDQRGHGKSDGSRGHIEKFSSYVSDLNTFHRIVRSKHHNAKVFILGHSLGGTIAALYTILHQDEFSGLILAGATLSTWTDVRAQITLAVRLLYRFSPGVSFDTMGNSQQGIVAGNHEHDPFVDRIKIRTRLGIELIEALETINEQTQEIRLPILVTHGVCDRLSPPKGSENLYKGASSRDKTLKLYEGFYHDIFNEPGREQIFSDIETWLSLRVNHISIFTTKR